MPNWEHETQTYFVKTFGLNTIQCIELYSIKLCISVIFCRGDCWDIIDIVVTIIVILLWYFLSHCHSICGWLKKPY